MSFRKRNVGLSGPSAQQQKYDLEAAPASNPGVRASPLDGRLTTSTGTASLDDILGHSGLALGHSILVEENGTTEFGTTLLRYFAAEGIVQGHKVHAIGVGESWARELPGISVTTGGDAAPLESITGQEKERMKIAWRYERLGEFGAGPSSARATPTMNRKPTLEISSENGPAPSTAFCHTFDLTKRLTISDPKSLNCIPMHIKSQNESPFHSILQFVRGQLNQFPSPVIHRLIIPSILSPALYPPHASNPQNVLQFLHSLRALLRQHSRQLVIFITLPLMLYPRSTGLTRWMELLSDGVIELSPFAHAVDAGLSTTSGAATAQEERPQGLVKVHRLPVFSEKGGGGIRGDDRPLKEIQRPREERETENQLK